MSSSRPKRAAASKKSKTVHKTAEVLIKQEPEDFGQPEVLEENFFADLQSESDGEPSAETSSGKKRQMMTYTPDQMTLALEAVKNGMKSYTAAKTYKVPRTTLKMHADNPHIRKVGSLGVFDEAGERKLVDWLHDMADLGDIRTCNDLMKAAVDLVKILNIPGFKSGTPSKNWTKSFRERHPSIVLRKQSDAIDSTAFIKNFRSFLERREMLEVLDRPDAFYVIEDTNFDFNDAPPNSAKRTQLRQMMAGKIAPSGNYRSKESATVIYTFNVKGLAMQPLMIFRNNSVDLMDVAVTCKDLDSNLLFTSTPDGCHNKNSFKAYLERLDVELKKVQRPIFVFCSETFPPVDFETFQTLKQKQIFVISYIPKEVSVLRTCSEEIFGMNNTGWSEIVKSMSADGKISAINFVKALTATNRNYLVKSSIEEGFRKAGIYPFDDVIESEEENFEEPPQKIQRIEKSPEVDSKSFQIIRQMKNLNEELKKVLKSEMKNELNVNAGIVGQQLQLMENFCRR